MNKKILIWSGGYDSTWILLNELQNNSFLETWSFIVDEIGQEKNEIERQTREKIISWLKDKGKTVENHEITLDLKSNKKDYGNLPQQHLWTIYSTLIGDPDTTFLFGFHEKDWYWSIEENLDNIRKLINKSMHKNILWEFPLREIPKYQIISVMFKMISEENFPSPWTCENPNKKDDIFSPCNECTPCITLKTAVYESNLRNYQPFSFKFVKDTNAFKTLDIKENESNNQ